MKFVGYMLYVIILPMCRSYSHERDFLWKMLRYDHGYVTCLYVPFYLVGDACTPIVAILLVYVSILACSSSPCIFEKHKLAFVDLIHALPIGGSTQFIFPRGVLNQGKNLWEKCICSGGACIHAYSCVWELFLAWLLVVLFCRWCRALFASPWGVSNFGAFYLGCVESLPMP
jgi:hypothetical protein